MEDEDSDPPSPKGKDKILVIALMILWIAVLLIIIIVSINVAGAAPDLPAKKPRPILDGCCKKTKESDAIKCFFETIEKTNATTPKPSNYTFIDDMSTAGVEGRQMESDGTTTNVTTMASEDITTETNEEISEGSNEDPFY